MIDRVEVSVIEEQQPRWLAFLNREHDLHRAGAERVRPIAIPNNKLAPNLAKQGIHEVRYLRADVSMSYFAMENPVVGGYDAGQGRAAPRDRAGVRRRARRSASCGAARRSPRRRSWRRGLSGYDPAFKTEMSDYDRARANALLDLYGYVDRDGDGWRDRPDGKPLVLEYATQPDELSRQLHRRSGRRTWTPSACASTSRSRKWPEHLKASRAGKLMMWGVALERAAPTARTSSTCGYGPNKGQANHARFDLPAFNALYEQQRALPDGPEREAR